MRKKEKNVEPRITVTSYKHDSSIPWPVLRKHKGKKTIETKEVLLEDLLDMLEIMNRADFWLNRGSYNKFKPRNTRGYTRLNSILKRRRMFMLDELNRPELEEEKVSIYKSVIGGGLPDVCDSREEIIARENKRICERSSRKA